MRMRDVGMSFIGGTLLYVAMAACSGHSAGVSATGPRAGAGGGGAAQTTGGGSGQGSGILDSGIVDALTNPVPPASADSGSRLKAAFRTGDDGSKEYLPGQWYDTMRSETCTFQVAGDGATRCLPAGVEFRYYADASCATAMVILESACATPTYATQTVGASCGLDPSGIHVFSLGAPVTPPMMFAKSGSQCIGLGAATTTGYQYITVGAEIPATTFVAGKIGHE